MMEKRQLPQLLIKRTTLSDLPAWTLPSGYACRSYQPGDDANWEAIVEQAFGKRRSFQQEIRSHFYFRPERVLFICKAGKPVATACAWYEPEWGEDCGYLHMVGVVPEAAGQRLGQAISLAALKQMHADGKRQALLETDDFRLPAIKTYLNLQFEPELQSDELLGRWTAVYQKLGLLFGVKVASFTQPGSPLRPNEDRLVVNPQSRIFGVIDGVSAMLAYQDEQGRTGGAIAAQLLADQMQAAVQPDVDLREAVLAANAMLLQRMERAQVEVTGKWRRWGAVFALLKWCGTHIEYVQCGDCMLFARYTDGTVRVITRNQVAAFDLVTLKAKSQLQKSGVYTAEEIASRLKPLFKCNRDKANALDGYAVMNGDPALEWHMESGRLSLANLQQIYMLTDGLFHFIENDEDPLKWEKLLARLDEVGIEVYMDELVAQEEQDADTMKYPRHKKSDDKSAVILTRSDHRAYEAKNILGV